MSIRIYQIDSKNYPSVTSILSFVFGIGDHLNRWSVKKAVEAILEAKDKVPDEDLAEIGEKARLEVLHKAQIKGTIVHTYIQHKADGVDPSYINPTYAPYYGAFLRFLAEHSLTPILQEKKVWNDVHEYAGRIDCYGFLDGKPVLIDFKTSKHLRPEYGLQLAAYRECLLRLGYPVEGTYILHLRESGRYTLKEYNEPFQAFVNLLPVFKWKVDKERPSMKIATDEQAVEDEQKAPASDDTEAALRTDEENPPLAALEEPAQIPELLVVTQFRLPHSILRPDEIEMQPLETESLIPKRGRGRPRKYPAPEPSGPQEELKPENPADDDYPAHNYHTPQDA